MASKWSKRALVLIGMMVLVAGVAITYVNYTPGSTPKGQPPLVNLLEDNLRPLEQIFNEGASRKRVLVLLSPT